MKQFDICVLGLGYIGLPTASVFSTKGKSVLGVDVVQSVVDTINDGRIHIEEPDLDILVKAAVQSGNLTAATRPAEADVFIIAVPTPFEERIDGSRVPDLKYVESATRSLASVVKKGDLVILESTSPVGTTEKMRDWLIEELIVQGNTEATDKDYHFVHCPERILPGQMLKELVTNDRISGGLTPEASQKAKELYECFCTAEIFLTDARSAELSKLTENSFRDVNIAFANELSMICDELGMDVWEVIKLSNRHPRVDILTPGPGVGGHCIAVDPWFIVDAAPERAKLIRTARIVNESKPEHVVSQVKRKAGRIKDPIIACLGLAFKANVDDLRESPALDITHAICEIPDAEVLVAEPHVQELPKILQGKCRLLSADEAVKAADIVVLLVDHKMFSSLSRPGLAEKIVIDTRGFWK
ncbi:UDP-N-acetyl-D-mannosamine dehydrogenase [Akkermansiaceae bacterium]|nr:UDP-N-acetyl-D-mannosamine dehydrogenase [Akkermansiaceae bacterium]MDB4480489.1 UDP-N-acetyl-D-mannosamine dehydrogenase [Akkermansiaceae bacterium]